MSLHIIARAIIKTFADELIMKYDKELIHINDTSYSVYYRHDFVDKDFSKRIYEIIKPWFPRGRIGSKWYFTKYETGGFIDIHRDGHATIDHVRSKYTILIYLNDDYDGGEVCFEDGGTIVVKPAVGSIIVMDQDLWHKGNPVMSGKKYLLRADMILI